jgi:sugar O-acyltransferase (sialic acid O-acetyltransferase NeuD family)
MNYLIGAGGHGLVIQDICKLSGLHIDAFLDNTIKPPLVRGIPCYLQQDVTISEKDEVIVSIGDNRVRKTISSSLTCRYLTAIHPTVIKDHSVTIGDGTVVMAGAILNAFVSVGRHAIINTGAVIDHECVISDFVHISPNATLCGNVHVGEGTHVGAGAVIIPNIKIGRGCIIGAGTVVKEDVPDHCVMVGNPGRMIRQLNKF